MELNIHNTVRTIELFSYMDYNDNNNDNFFNLVITILFNFKNMYIIHRDI